MRRAESVWQAPSELPRWQARLRHLFPRVGPHLSFLELVWRPDVGRLVIYQCFPPASIPPAVYGPGTNMVLRPETLLGVTRLKMSADPRQRIHVNRGLVTRWAWQLYRELGCYAQPFWIIQGARGGHKWQFTHAESTISQLHHGPADPPEIGELPYAPFDERVVRALAPLDAVQTWNLAARSYLEREERDLATDERQMLEGMRTQLWRWLAAQVDMAADEAEIDWGSDRGGYDDADLDADALEESFITDDD